MEKTKRNGMTVEFYVHGIKINEKFYWKDNAQKVKDVKNWEHKSASHFVKYK